VTQTLTFVRGDVVTHVADRLVSRGGAPWDPESNKTVIFTGDLGVGVISYSGAAFIGPRHTDELIASAVAGENVEDALADSAIVMGGARAIPDVGQVALRVARRLEREGDAAQVPELLLPQFVAAGWKWRLRRPNMAVGIEPFAFVAVRRQGRGKYAIADQWNGRDPRAAIVVPVPRGWIPNSVGKGLVQRLSGAAPESVTALLIEATREAARSAPAIGTDVMAITIHQPTAQRDVLVHFDGTPSVHGSWSPWVVAPDYLQGPIQWASGWDVPFGLFRIVSSGPEGGDIGLDTHKRRK
jgi:hypothetical protein